MKIKSLIPIWALSLAGLTSAAPNTFGRPCGLKIAPCPAGFLCVPTNPLCANIDLCLGLCVFWPIHLPLPTVTLSLPTGPTSLPQATSPSQLPSSSPTPIEPTKSYPTCSILGIKDSRCSEDSYCANDPRVPINAFVKTSRICIPKNAKFCGGFAGFRCPTGFGCYDAPNDSCDPRNGGADCGGICLWTGEPSPDSIA